MTPDEIHLGCKKGHLSKSQNFLKELERRPKDRMTSQLGFGHHHLPLLHPLPHSKLTKKLPQLRPRLGRRRCRTQIRFPLPGLLRRVARLSARRHLVDKLITALYPTSCLIAGQLPADKLLQ